MKKIIALLLALTLVMGLGISASAISIADTRESVVVINPWFEFDEQVDGLDNVDFGWGTGFFVGVEGEDPTYIVTNYHVIEAYVTYGSGQPLNMYPYVDQYGNIVGYLTGRAKIRVNYSDSEYEEGYLIAYDEIKDIAVLKLAGPTNKRVPLKLRKPESKMAGTSVYVVGYPGLADNTQLALATTKWGQDDATVTGGSVSRLFVESGTGIEKVQVDCIIRHGNSGGPVVNENGEVIAIATQGMTSSSDETVFYGISINEVIPYLRMHDVAFDLVDDNTPAPTEPVVVETEAPVIETPVVETEPAFVADVSALEDAIAEAGEYVKADYTEDSYKALSDAVKAGKKAMTSNDQDAIDEAAEAIEDAIDGLVEPTNMMPIIIGAAAALVVLIVVIIVVSSKKKKPAPAPVHVPAQPAARPVQPAAPQSGSFTRENSGDVGGTTVLNTAAVAETGILVSGGSLVRSSNKETIKINALDFVMGRDPGQVSYCIKNNTNVGRTHAKIVVRGGKSFLVDLNSKNGTFLNGARLNKMEENELKAGDKIKLADEEFVFQA